MMTKPLLDHGERAGYIELGYTLCLDCGAENKTPVVMNKPKS